MELNEYQKKALTTAFHAEKHKIIYPALGLGNEAGEVLGKIKKWVRGDDGEGEISADRKQALKEELGDVLWYVAVLAHDLGLSLGDIAQTNVDKLQSRKERGKLQGDGDKR
ncbi:nucleoside triphosphate pyrophosphohydrolase family protein [Candidatus Nomurabacteria bacterium]|nr:nucleoside triphosphate pyrophosphohydrolase family protein [Candidatus Nomurabacteria bacterium]